MPKIDEVLDATHEVFAKNESAWKREERRFYGGDAVLAELERFTSEEDDAYKARQAQVPYLNFGRIHAQIIVGHLAEVAPMPNYGTLGQVREREAIPRNSETPAERFHYNANGVGSNGLPFPALATAIQMRALATGFRWTMVEMPRRPGRSDDAPITQQDVRNGHRPFIVEYSPLSVPMWEATDGRLDWAVIRTRWRGEGEWEAYTGKKGYYLLVREGYAGIGDQFAGGGWWLYDPDKNPAGEGTWARTKGEIPLCQFTAEESEGTEEWPAVAVLKLMELGQLSVALMNRNSEWHWDARDAAKSIKYVLGAEDKAFNLMIEHHKANSILVPVVGSATPDGKWLIPSIYDGSSGAIPAEVFSTITTNIISQAHEVMVRQLTSTPESSGRSKEAGFNEATSPMLSALSVRRSSWENTVIPWAEMRAGAEQPKGFVDWPTEFDLTPVVQKIERFFDALEKRGARSPVIETRGFEEMATGLGVWPDVEADARLAREELAASLASAQVAVASESVAKLTAAGGSIEGAAQVAGLTADQTRLLVGGPEEGSADQGNPDAGVVVPEGDQEPGTGAPSLLDENGENGRITGRVLNVSNLPETAPAEPPALTEIRSQLTALTEQVAALVAALATR